MLTVSYFENLESFNCILKIKLENEESAPRWIAEYNVKIKETLVFDCCKKLSGKKGSEKTLLTLSTQTKTNWKK